MQFTSVHFLIFLILVIIGYNSVSSKYKYLFILFVNVLFYYSWTGKTSSFIPLLIVILITWILALLFQMKKNAKMLICSLLIGLSFLIYYKYIDFILDNINVFLQFLKIDYYYLQKNPFAPIGISFYTFQAVGYLIDVYKGKYAAEKNLLKYATFVSFFPTISSGPIERANTFLSQLKDSHKKSTFEDFQRGCILFLYGLFIKIAIANRLAIISDNIFMNYTSYGGSILFFGTISYTLQIYCDFSSYSLMAVAVSKMLGIDVTDNFDAPYFSETIQEFWRRWHISLSTWFRDYVYIPLGGNRCNKIRKNFNLLITFLVSGIWHGANWTYITWGALHGLYQIIGNLTKTSRDKAISILRIKTNCFSYHFLKKVFVFLCVAFAWIFFRSDTLIDAIHFINIMITEPKLWEIVDGTRYSLGLSFLQLELLYIFTAIMLMIDYIRYKTQNRIDTLLLNQNVLFRGFALVVLIMGSLIFGVYGPGFSAQDFIYFKF